MITETKKPIPAEVMADLQAVADSLGGGKPLDPEVVRRLRERAEKARQDRLTSHGVQDIGVPITA